MWHNIWRNCYWKICLASQEKKSFKDIFKYKIIILTIKSAHQGCIYLIENTEIEQQYY